MSVRALDGGSMAGSVRAMAHPCKSTTETIIELLTEAASLKAGAVWRSEIPAPFCVEGFGGLR